MKVGREGLLHKTTHTPFGNTDHLSPTPLYPPLNSLCLSMAVAEGLSSGLLMRQRAMKSWKSADQPSWSLRVGEGLVGIMKMALIGWTSA